MKIDTPRVLASVCYTRSLSTIPFPILFLTCDFFFSICLSGFGWREDSRRQGNFAAATSWRPSYAFGPGVIWEIVETRSVSTAFSCVFFPDFPMGYSASKPDMYSIFSTHDRRAARRRYRSSKAEMMAAPCTGRGYVQLVQYS